MKTFTPSKENFIQFNRFFQDRPGCGGWKLIRYAKCQWTSVRKNCIQLGIKSYVQFKSPQFQTYFGRSLCAAASLNSCVRNCAKILLPLPLQNLVCLAKKKFAECNALFSDGGEWRGGPLLKYKTSYYIVPALPCPPLHLPPPILMCK